MNAIELTSGIMVSDRLNRPLVVKISSSSEECEETRARRVEER